jgi:hypothetical protein
MKMGKCIKSGSNAVYTLANDVGGLYGQDVFDGKSSQRGAVVTYACTACGYFEDYLTDPKKLDLINQEWQKVS